MGGGLDFQAGIFQKLMSEARRHAKRAASHAALLRATKLQRPKASVVGGANKKKKKKPGTSGVGGGGGGGSTGTSTWWRAALRLLTWDRRDDHRGSTTNANEIEELHKPQPRPDLVPARCTLYFVSADPPPPPYGTPRWCRPRKRRAMAAGRRVRPEGIRGKMTVLRKTTPYMCLSDLNAVEDEGGGRGRARLIALVARPPPPPPIYWVA